MPKKKKNEEKPKMTYINAYDYMLQRQKIIRLSTGIKELDSLIGGGLEPTEPVEFYGDYGTSKTQLCQSIAATVISEGKKVLWVDVENTYVPERTVEMLRCRGKTNIEIQESFANLILVTPRTVDEMLESINQIPKDLDVYLVIVDSLTKLYREEYVGRGTLAVGKGALRQFITVYKAFLRKHNCYGITTNQVFDNPEMLLPNAPQYLRKIAVGGPTVFHSINHRLFMRKGPRGTRIARLMDSSWLPEGEAVFKITECGCVSVEEETEEPKKEEVGGEEKET